MPIYDLILIFAGLCGCLTLASATSFLLRWRVHEAGTTRVIENLNQRVQTWWVIVFILAGAMLGGPKAIVALFFVLSFVALREFLTVTAVGSQDRAGLLVSFLIFLPVQYMLVVLKRYEAFAVFIPICGFATLPVFAAITGNVKGFLERTAELLWGLMLCVYAISHLPALLLLDIPGYQNRQTLLIIFVILIAQANDVLQYVWGKLLGSHKIAPVLSPSKTVEGFLGGAVCSTALGASLWWLTPFTVLQSAAMALVIALAGFVGGLVLSAIKRDRGLKDWSQFVPGHGGLLDRLDSLCFSAPLFFHLTRVLFAA